MSVVLRRLYPGLRISQDAVHAVVLCRRKKLHHLRAARGLSFDTGVVVPSRRELNIKRPDAFVEALTNVLCPITGHEDRIALSLPDASGHIVLTQLDSPSKSREEGRDILRWQLRKNLPGEWKDIHLDFQVLRREDSGRQQVLTAIIDRAVLNQYEELVIRAGFHAVQVGFHSLDLYAYYRSRLEMGGDFVFIGIEGATLTIEIFQDGVPVFYRVRSFIEDADQVFQELNRSLSGMRSAQRGKVFLHSDWTGKDALSQVLASLFDTDPVVLDPQFSRMVDPEYQQQFAADAKLASAIGAAERMM
ncbi:MAG: type IV pilus biogenesis protein PilM [Geoalkalibacter sp.]|uniref:type IV pilus biogenesis protein PilM n=1 Tax=Geoalkalibacter sp. TaxID=3041440 RepID=UPI003D0AAC1E